jgi:hypothetical protein
MLLIITPPQRCSVLQGVRHGYRESHFSSYHLEGFLAGAVFLLLPVLLVQQAEGWLQERTGAGLALATVTLPLAWSAVRAWLCPRGLRPLSLSLLKVYAILSLLHNNDLSCQIGNWVRVTNGKTEVQPLGRGER